MAPHTYNVCGSGQSHLKNKAEDAYAIVSALSLAVIPACPESSL